MARRSSTSMFSRIIYGAIVLVFGLIALAVTYQAFTQGVNLRSKAAQMDVLYKGWEFNGKTVEGWVGEPHKTSVANGKLRLDIRKTKSVPDILQKKANASLPQGNKYLKLSISVGGDGKRSVLPNRQAFAAPIEGFRSYSVPQTSSQGEIVKDPEFVQSVTSQVVCVQDVQQCPDGSYLGRIGPSCVFAPCSVIPTRSLPPKSTPIPPQRTIRAAVYYKLVSSKRWEKPLEFDVVADGSSREYLVRFPEIAATTVERIRIAFPSGLRMGDIVLFDWIRLVGMKRIPPPPLPTGAPYTCGGIKGDVCPSGYICLMEATYPDAGGKCVPSDSRMPTQYISPTPQPTYYPSPTSTICKYGVNGFAPYDSCGAELDLWRHARYSCYGPIQGVLGSGKECLSSSAWNKQAIAACGYSSNCDITPTPTPSYYTTPYPSPTSYYPSPTNYYPSSYPSYSPVPTY